MRLPLRHPPPPVDTDGDGFIDAEDNCVDVPGTAPDGCPDTDGDGFKDPVDKCPTVPGIEPDGVVTPDFPGQLVKCDTVATMS